MSSSSEYSDYEEEAITTKTAGGVAPSSAPSSETNPLLEDENANKKNKTIKGNNDNKTIKGNNDQEQAIHAYAQSFLRFQPFPNWCIFLFTLIPTIYLCMIPWLANQVDWEGRHYRFFAISPQAQMLYLIPDVSLYEGEEGLYGPTGGKYVGMQEAKEECEKLAKEEMDQGIISQGLGRHFL